MTYDRDRNQDFDDNNELWDDELSLDEYPDSNDSGEPEHDYYQAPPDKTESSDHDYYSGQAEDADEDTGNADTDYYSDPDPDEKSVKKSVKDRIFGGSSDEDDEENDFFSSDSVETPRKKKVASPRLDPEDPDYWIQDESPIEGIIHRPPRSWKWIIIVVVTAIALIGGAWIWFMRPYSDGAIKYGYITKMERRGSLLKTFEGVMIPYKELGDPNPLHFEQLHFSVEGDSLASVMKRMMLDCIPVRVEYESYHSPLFWKGESAMIVVKADPADPSKMLPPEYR